MSQPISGSSSFWGFCQNLNPSILMGTAGVALIAAPYVGAIATIGGIAACVNLLGKIGSSPTASQPNTKREDFAPLIAQYEELLPKIKEKAGITDTYTLELRAKRAATDIKIKKLIQDKSILLTVSVLHSTIFGKAADSDKLIALIKTATSNQNPIDLYFQHFGDELSWKGKLVARIWFFLTHDFITKLTENLVMNLLNEIRAGFDDKTPIMTWVKEVLKDASSTISPYTGQSALPSNDLQLHIICRKLSEKIISDCLPDIEYFKNYHSPSVVGTFFKQVDKIISKWTKNLLGEAITSTLGGGKDIPSEGVIASCVPLLVNPLFIRPQIAGWMEKISTALNKPDSLSNPAKFKQEEFAEVKPFLKGLILDLYSSLNLRELVPFGDHETILEDLASTSTEKLLQAILEFGSPIKLEEYLLLGENAAQEFFREPINTVAPLQTSIEGLITEHLNGRLDKPILELFAKQVEPQAKNFTLTKESSERLRTLIRQNEPLEKKSTDVIKFIQEEVANHKLENGLFELVATTGSTSLLGADSESTQKLFKTTREDFLLKLTAYENSATQALPDSAEESLALSKIIQETIDFSNKIKGLPKEAEEALLTEFHPICKVLLDQMQFIGAPNIEEPVEDVDFYSLERVFLEPIPKEPLEIFREKLRSLKENPEMKNRFTPLGFQKGSSAYSLIESYGIKPDQIVGKTSVFIAQNLFKEEVTAKIGEQIDVIKNQETLKAIITLAINKLVINPSE